MSNVSERCIQPSKKEFHIHALKPETTKRCILSARSKQGQKIQFYTMEILSVSWIFSDLGSNHSQVTTEKKSIVISVLEFIGSVRI